MHPNSFSNPHNREYSLLLSYRNWADLPFESKMYNFVIAPLDNLKYRVSEHFPPLPSENKNTVKWSTNNKGRDNIHQASYPILKQFYSLTDCFLYDYNYDFRLPLLRTFDHLVAKASQDLSAYSLFEHATFLYFNSLFYIPVF